MCPVSYHSYSYQSSVSHSFKSSVEYDGEDDQAEDLTSALLNNTLRTQMLILDYKQFKAARIIQKTFRGWSVRNSMKKIIKAAIMIQSMWRCYVAMHHLEIVAQEKAQKSILILFESCFIKIQALFRGWWSQKHVNNLVTLKIHQLNAVQDILYCVARKLHIIMRTAKLLGVSSLCDPECLCKVEDLLISMSDQMYSPIVAKKCLVLQAQRQQNREDYRNAQLYTWVPYNAFNCDPPPNCENLLKAYNHIEEESFYEARRIIKKAKLLLPKKI